MSSVSENEEKEQKEQKEDKEEKEDKQNKEDKIVSPQNQFFNFYQDKHGNPTYSKEFAIDDDEIASPSIESPLTDNQNQNHTKINVTCCFLCILISISIALIIVGVGLHYGFMPPQKKYSNDKNYPECNMDLFDENIKPLIRINLLNSINEMKETDKLENNGYHMNKDVNIIQNIVKEIKKDNIEMILLYGAIERHRGTLQIFDQIEQNMNEPVILWLIDSMILNKYNGTAHQRCLCLFHRAEQWVNKHKTYRLLLVFDHLSHYYAQNDQITDRGYIWNQLQSLIHWKKSKKWTLFIIESDPNNMNIKNNNNYAKKLFYQNSKTKAIYLPFQGGLFFEKVMKRLISNNIQMMKINYNLNNNDSSIDEQWKILKNEMKYYTLSDAFAIYYNRIRSEAKEMYSMSNSLPITFEFNHILSIIQEYNNKFTDKDIIEIKEFSSLPA